MRGQYFPDSTYTLTVTRTKLYLNYCIIRIYEGCPPGTIIGGAIKKMFRLFALIFMPPPSIYTFDATDFTRSILLCYYTEMHADFSNLVFLANAHTFQRKIEDLIR